MKRTAFWTGVFIAGGLLALISDLTLGALWIGLEWREPVSDWLVTKGVPLSVVAHWSIIWISLPDWATLLLLGALIGRLAHPGKWLRYGLFSGCGFIAYGLIYSIPYCIRVADHDSSLAMGTFLHTMVLNVVSLLVLLLAAWLFRRKPRKPTAETSAAPVTQT